MTILTEILVPIAICVVLPVLIVWIVFRTATNNDNRRAEVLIKAIEANNGIDTDRLAEALAKPKKSPADVMYKRLLRGCTFTLIGVGCLIYLLCVSFDPDSSTDTRDFLSIAGIVMTAVGLSNLIVYFVSRRKILDDNK